jgi:hypothetical protein
MFYISFSCCFNDKENIFLLIQEKLFWVKTWAIGSLNYLSSLSLSLFFFKLLLVCFLLQLNVCPLACLHNSLSLGAGTNVYHLCD